MFHSDQGVQYSAKIFRDKLALLNITQSINRTGNCWNNAVMERLFRSLKTERLNNITFINHVSMVDEVESYIRFYNYKRRHSSLGYITLRSILTSTHALAPQWDLAVPLVLQGSSQR